MALVRPLPGRRALPALRYATAVAVLLLVAAFAVDGTGVFEGGILSRPKTGPEVWNYRAATITAGENEEYWLVPGVENALDSQKEDSVILVVPDGTDNVDAAVNSLATGGAVYGAIIAPSQDEVPQLVLTEGDSEAARAGELTRYMVLSDSNDTENGFATNDGAVPSELDEIMEKQVGIHLNILSSDNVLYSFQVDQAHKEVTASGDNDWLRPLEYGLIGLVAVLAGGMAAVWLKQRRARVAEVTQSQN